MKLKIKLGLAAVGAALVLAPAAYASGIFQGYPILSTAAFCDSTNSGSPSNTVPGTLPSGSVCTNTVPAGPTSLTGNELVAADTGLPNGGTPQTIRVPTAALGGGSIGVVTTSASVVMAQGQRYLISNQGVQTIALVNLPPNPVDNQVASIVNSGSGALTLTSIAVGATPSGTTIVQGAAPTTLAVETAATSTQSAVDYVYQASSNKWFRIQ